MSIPTARRRASHFALALLAVLISGANARPALATDGVDFVVADDEGYGIADCMKPGVACGRVMADAWCESHGHGHASAFGMAEDATSSIKVSTGPQAPSLPGAVMIRCGE